MWKEYSLLVGADGFAARGHTRPRIFLSRAKAMFFRVYDGALKPSRLYNFLCPYQPRNLHTWCKTGIYYRALKSKSLYDLTTINK